MNRRLYRNLWKVRFEKMLSLEKKAIREYGALLRECETKYPTHPILPHIRKIIAAENRHVLLAKELQSILILQPY